MKLSPRKMRSSFPSRVFRRRRFRQRKLLPLHLGRKAEFLFGKIRVLQLTKEPFWKITFLKGWPESFDFRALCSIGAVFANL
jgi:hypothetical protein